MLGVLLLYATTHGHTAKIANRIGRTLSAEGLDVDVRRAVALTAAEESPDAREATQRGVPRRDGLVARQDHGTDWDSLDRFGRDFAGLVRSSG